MYEEQQAYLASQAQVNESQEYNSRNALNPKIVDSGAKLVMDQPGGGYDDGYTYEEYDAEV
jgi:hypothetical protein